MGDLASAIGMAAEEATLVAELQAGSEQAFALLIAQYSQPVYSMIARSLRDPADAADVTQEVFVKVFRHSAASMGMPVCGRGSIASRCMRSQTSGAGGRGTRSRK